ncbi:DUF4439 domain-containing protein [Actinomadura citrea]|uniref:DUF4439 domain-containing protein n=1 Tax=Actinomadura citrea TaxID=46158 RepID=A0A7Y9G997_9ACTN|nr:DUF4439 domain-containing protein [Actinomadura citrea]NYE12223.1 hypothetical protein [Actinomadura citrea]GGT50423.1 hypothetical protein GCM10010177_02790 [Actinomadura citrea]
MSRSTQALSRRALLGRAAVLGGGAVPVLPWLASCAAEAAPRKDVPTLVGAIAAEQNLVAAYEAARSANPSQAGRLDPVLGHHRRHLAVLRRHYVPGSGNRADEGGSIPSPDAAPVLAGAAGLAALRDMEDRAARGRMADAAKAGPALAQLLASIGACEAGHAMTVKGGAPPVRSRSDAEAVQAALAAEHAAVYGYGVLGARLRGTLRQTAKDLWNVHRARRDQLVSILSVAPVAAASAYRLPVAVTSARSAAQLAAALEGGLVPAYVGLAGVSSPDLRAFAADSAQRASAWAARWRSRSGAAAPAEAFPGLPSAALSPRPEPGE